MENLGELAETLLAEIAQKLEAREGPTQELVGATLLLHKQDDAFGLVIGVASSLRSRSATRGLLTTTVMQSLAADDVSVDHVTDVANADYEAFNNGTGGHR